MSPVSLSLLTYVPAYVSPSMRFIQLQVLPLVLQVEDNGKRCEGNATVLSSLASTMLLLRLKKRIIHVAKVPILRGIEEGSARTGNMH